MMLVANKVTLTLLLALDGVHMQLNPWDVGDKDRNVGDVVSTKKAEQLQCGHLKERHHKKDISFSLVLPSNP